MKEKTDKLDFNSIKNFYSIKDTVKRMKKKSDRPKENIYKRYI